MWLPCQASGVIGSALGLVGPVSASSAGDWGSLPVVTVASHTCDWKTGTLLATLTYRSVLRPVSRVSE